MRALLERLEEALAASEGAVAIASDGDNTLWRGDIGEALFFAALDGRLLRDEALEALVAEAESCDLEVPAREPHAVAARLYEAYGQGRYPEERTFAMMAWAFAGYRQDELSALCRRVLDAFGFEAALREELRPVLGWARARELPFWLVSASPLGVVQEAARRLELDAARVVAMTPAAEGDVLLPRLGLEPTYAEGKLRRLRAATDAPLLAAFGDSGYDAAMLRVAAVPVAVHPAPSLRAQLGGMAGALIVGDG